MVAPVDARHFSLDLRDIRAGESAPPFTGLLDGGTFDLTELRTPDGLNVETRTEIAHRVADSSPWMGEVEVPSPRTRADPRAARRMPVGVNKSAHGLHATVAGVDIDDHQDGFFTGAHGKVRPRPQP